MNSNKRESIYKIIMLVVLVAIVTFVVTSIFVYNYLRSDEGAKYVIVQGTDTSNIDQTLSGIKKIIDSKYLGEVNEGDMIAGAIKGYVDGLNDPYTEYYTPEEMQEIETEVMGNFVGIGIYMTVNTEDNTIVIISPIKDTPAEKAGLLPGDIISKVDDISYTGEQMTLAASKIKGEEGTTVKLEIIRDGETLDFEIKRETIKINHVEGEMLENNIGYISFYTFDEGSAEEFKTKLLELKNQGMKSLIIDIRNNGGGIVDEALKIADYILEKGNTTLITVDKNQNEEISYSDNDPIIKDIPIIVLTNEGTASASEILAGALKDNGKAQIVGTKTYGKGVIQQLMTLLDGSGLKITTNEYFTPNRNKINEVGIEPDVVVENEGEETIQEKSKDAQLQKAIELIKKGN